MSRMSNAPLIRVGQVWKYKGARSTESYWTITNINGFDDTIQVQSLKPDIDYMCYDYVFREAFGTKRWELYKDIDTDKCVLCNSSVKEDYLCQKCLIRV